MSLELMGCEKENNTRVCLLYSCVKAVGLFLLLFCSSDVSAQEEDDVVKALLNAGFENVGYSNAGEEELIVFENSVWRANGEGISEAIKIIEKYPFVPGKSRRVVVLKNKVPQVSLLLHQANTALDSTSWKVSYDLGNNWKYIPEKNLMNNSRWKVDLVFYPQLSLRNQKYEKIYDVLFNIAPALEISPMRGMKITGQVIIPVINQYGAMYEEVRPGFLTIQQNFRVENVFAKVTLGNFNQNRWGMDLTLFRPFKKGWLDHFALKGEIGLTGSSYFTDWNWHYGNTSLVTWNVGGSYYNPQFNVQCDLSVEKFLAGDIGVRADMTRHFKRVSVGFYAMKNNRDNVDGGFHFAILIPPIRQKRTCIRVSPARYFNMEYKAAGLFYNGRSYKTSPGQNRAEDNFNPYYIKSQLK